MRVFVTGADGFLGSNLLRELLKQNRQVVALVQNGRDHSNIEDLDIEIREGDLLDPESLIRHSADCDAIIHTAANTDIWPPRQQFVNKINIEGTRNILHTCKANNIKRLVYVGTANSFGFGSLDDLGDETKPYKAAKYGLDYMDSKYAVQQMVTEAARSGEVPAVIVNPTFMYGPYDSKPGPGVMLIGIYHEKAPGYSPGGRNLVSVKDASVAIANALERGRIGESYILAGENLNYKDLFAMMAEVAGSKPPTFPVPAWATLIFGIVSSFFGRLFNYKPKVSKEMAMISIDKHYFSSKKAQEELGLPQTPVKIAIQEAFDWFRENGYLQK